MKKTLLLACLALAFVACSDDSTSPATEFSDTNDETSQQVGDAMASIDDAGGSGGSIALNQSIEKTFHRLAPTQLDGNTWANFFSQPAYATSCFAPATFSPCASKTITHTFAGCNIRATTLNGSVSLVWTSAGMACSLGSIGDSIRRDPEYTVTGLRGATLTVSQTGVTGQTLTWNSGASNSKVFSFTSDGINRKFITPGSNTLFDFTTSTDEAITVTGTGRANRTMDGGKLKVVNNKNGKSCTFVPSSVKWNSENCNCATSGTWKGSCDAGKTESTIVITGCVTADVTVGDNSGAVTFDRCIKL